MTEADIDRQWWKEAVVYQIYPRSFKDTDGDGLGDLPGIVDELDYLSDLGVDVVWLNPVYESPGADNGYDIADYRAIDDQFGDMGDWERLLDGLHERGIKLIMDLVVNHTSDEHEWFVESRKSRDNEYRDYYIWREGRPADEADYDCEEGPEGEIPPNNWQSFFGGPAWSYDERTEEWYLHIFDEKQPDLNWENPEVRAEIYDMMTWWLEKGIDGFRMDVINLISKPADLADGADPEALVVGADRFMNGPRIHEFISEMHEEVLAEYDAMTVGEMAAIDAADARQYARDGMNMAFTFDHVRLDFGPNGRWSHGEFTLPELKGAMTYWQQGLGDEGWNAVFLGNHDEPRIVSRFGNDGEYRVESAKLLATLLNTLQGTPYILQGDELGMTNYPFESLDEVRDVDTLNNVRVAKERGQFTDDAELLDLVRQRSRDNARTPMQWSGEETHAGFTAGEPWIPVNPNYQAVNVADARADPESVWHYYRRVVDLRHGSDLLVYGDYDLYFREHEDLWVYARTLDDERVLVALNFSDTETTFEPPAEFAGRNADLLVGNYEAEVDVDAVEPTPLRPWEARVYDLE